MRIQKIELSWFRGAASEAILETDLKSVVIYGTNASGKSTFVDGLEYVIGNGRIRHLAHEYSGFYQEKGIRNTKSPDNENSNAIIYFEGNQSVSAEIRPNGDSTISSEPKELASIVQGWDVESHLLRQDEVARFILKSKGEKYSALLPLLGLENLEEAAENLHQLRVIVIDRSGMEENKIRCQQLIEQASEDLESLEMEYVLEGLRKLCASYRIEEPADDIGTLAGQLISEIEKQVKQIEPELNRYMKLKEMLDEKPLEKLVDMISANNLAERAVDAALDLRISVLEPTEKFLSIIENPEEEIICPACGQRILGSSFIEHVRKELESQKQARTAREIAKSKRKTFASTLTNLLKKASEQNLESWLNLPEQQELLDLFRSLSQTEIPGQDDVRWEADAVSSVKDILTKLVCLLTKRVESAPPSTRELVENMGFVKSCAKIPEIRRLQADIEVVQLLVDFLEKSESSVRNEIRKKTKQTLDEISDDVKLLWSKLHPNELIEDIKLYVHSGSDKAIDIGLMFYGINQPSPRLTLSEGYRNCLGLCIFLALAKSNGSDNPIILDDIVSSLDREHRGMLADVIMEELTNRQVILLTHDREWYSELRYRLPVSKWKFMALRPWINPQVGLRWSESVYTFDDARALIDTNTEACGNRTRAIMDVQLSIISEKLKVPMPYLRGDRNDHRTCIDFLNRIVSEARKRYKKRTNGKWEPYAAPISEWEKTKSLLIPWGDRASHTGSLTRNEAEKLIEACEKAIEYFKCSSCNEYIWIADQITRERLQCACGELQWRYG